MTDKTLAEQIRAIQSTLVMTDAEFAAITNTIQQVEALEAALKMARNTLKTYGLYGTLRQINEVLK
jgi:hypothetical protein